MDSLGRCDRCGERVYSALGRCQRLRALGYRVVRVELREVSE
jgi:hypothetical protein